MIEVIRYSKERKNEWDQFVSKAKNNSFLFYRDYMEYHADRFEDYSLMLYDKNKLKAIFPGNKAGDVFNSHGGLTFGGIITGYETSSLSFIDYFKSFSKYLKQNTFREVIYKATPQIYKTHNGDEELYVMFRENAKLVASNLASCINLHAGFSLTRNRKRNINKSKDEGLISNKSDRWDEFWAIMIENLKSRHDASPVHTSEEMKYLNTVFPDNIELIEVAKDGRMYGGAVIYKFNQVLKVQYAHASSEGKVLGAVDNIYNYLIENYKGQFMHIDFGHSNLDDGNYINEGLINQKEGFGARGVVLQTYNITL